MIERDSLEQFQILSGAPRMDAALAQLLGQGAAFRVGVAANGDIIIIRLSDNAVLRISAASLSPQVLAQLQDIAAVHAEMPSPWTADTITDIPAAALLGDDVSAFRMPEGLQGREGQSGIVRRTEDADENSAFNDPSGMGGASQMGLDNGAQMVADMRALEGTEPVADLTTIAGAERVDGIVVPELDGSSIHKPREGLLQESGASGNGGNGDSGNGGPTPPAAKASVAITADALSVTEGVDGHAYFTLTLSRAVNEDVVITYRTVNGTAGAGDFTPVYNTITIPAGQTSVQISVEILDDGLFEFTEHFGVQVVSAQTASGGLITLTGGGTQANVDITDDDTAPAISISSPTVEEGQYATFVITLDRVSAVPVSGNWSLAHVTTTDFDFGGIVPSGTFTIPAGQTSFTVTVPTYDDALTENTESFKLVLDNVTGAQATDAEGIGYITDNDNGLRFDVTEQSVGEGDGIAYVTIVLPEVHGYDVVVTYRTRAGTAGADDFGVINTATITIPAGSLTAQIPVTILDDAVYEGDEAFSVEIISAVDSNSAPYNYTTTPHIVHIADDEVLPTLTLSNAQASEGGTLVFTVSVSGPSAFPITGNWSVLAGMANAADFPDGVLPSGTFTIPAGQTSVLISVPTRDDLQVEPDETFTLELSGISGAQAGPVTGTGTILNDDFGVYIEGTTASVHETDGVHAVTFRVTSAHSEDIVITYRTVHGTAGADDYTGTGGGTATVVIPAGQLSAQISIPVTADGVYDGGDETFRIEIVDAQDTVGGPIQINDEGQTVTIIDNEVPPTLTMGNISMVEGGTFAFTVTASHASDAPITGNWAVLAGTANAADFPGGVLPSGTFTIPAGATSATITFASRDDALIEADESFTVRLDGIAGADTTPVTATGTIVNNDFGVYMEATTATVNEGDGTHDVTFRLTSAHTEDVIITYRTVTGTAGADDFTGIGLTTVTIPAGSLTATVSVAILDDAVYDGGNETFTVEIVSAVDGAGGSIALGDTVQTVTIIDNEAPPTLTMGNVSMVEGGTFVFTITASHAADAPITGNWAVLAGLANAADFPGGVLPSGTFTIPAGATSATITFASRDDLQVEADESFTLRLNNIQNADPAPVIATGTIINNDFGVYIDGASATVNEADGAHVITFRVTSVHSEDIVITYRTVNGTAGAGDYTGTGGGTATVVIPAGSLSAQISIPVTADGIYEGGDETFLVEIVDAEDTAGGAIQIGDAAQTVTIIDADAPPTLTMGNVSMTEGGTFVFTVTASHMSAVPITGNWAVLAGMANAADFPGGVLPSGTFTIPAGATSATITFASRDDAVIEADETFGLQLSGIQNASPALISATGTILNNDFRVDLTGTPVVVDEGDGVALVTVNITPVYTKDVTITYRTVNGTAGTDDYTGTASATVTIPAGSTSVQIAIPITDDAVYDGGNEAFSVEIIEARDSDNTAIPVGNGSQTVTIIDNELPPTLTMGDVSMVEGGTFVFTVTASHAADAPITGNWAVLAGIANAADFPGGVLPSGTFTIPAGATSATITFASNDDTDVEIDESFTLELSNINNADPAPVTATGTILNNDFGVYIEAETVTVQETDGVHNVTFRITSAYPHDVVITYRTVNGTAGADDFTGISSATVVIPAGQLSVSVPVTIIDDAVYDGGDETFAVELISAIDVNDVSIPLGNASQTVTIVDDELPPTLSMGDVSMTEGGTFVFTVTASHAADAPITGNWAVLAGIANAADFPGGVLPSGTFTIPAGATTATITFATNDDNAVELDESFTLELSGIANADPAPVTATGTIVNNDFGVYVVDTAATVNEGDGTHDVTFRLTSVHTEDVIITYRTVHGTAGADDYGPIAETTVTIPAGQLTATVSVTITDDAVYDGGDETFAVEIVGAIDGAGGYVGLGDTVQTVTIVDDELPPTLTMGDVSVTEGGTFVFTVTASHASDAPITGNWAVLAGMANAADFPGGVLPSGTFTIPAGATSATITFATNDDANIEADESFTLRLDNIANADPAPVTATGTILNNDYRVDLTGTPVVVNEDAGVALVTLAITPAYDKDVVVTYRTVNGTAGDDDYTGTASSTITIPAGSTSVQISVPITDDGVYDGGNETFSIEILGAEDVDGGAIQIGNDSQTVTIIDNEAAPTLTMGNVSMVEGGTFVFTVTASHASDAPITGDWAILAGTANAADFPGGVLPSGTFTIPAGATSATITFASNSDTDVEADETFTVQLDNIVNADPAPVAATGTIENDDYRVDLTSTPVMVNEADGNALITLTITPAYDKDVVVTYRTVNGTAGDDDYTGTASSTITIPAGSTSVQISVPITDDGIYDGGNEIFSVEILGAEDVDGGVIHVGNDSQTVVITDAQALPVLTMTSESAREGQPMVFTITTSQISDTPITGNWSVLAGTANAADFGGTFPTGTFTIPAGATSTTITITANDDITIEGDETFTVLLDSIAGADTAPVTGTGTIVNNDSLVYFAEAADSVLEDAGTHTARVQIDAPYAHDITITYRTVAGTAGGADYTEITSGTITIPAGSTFADIVVAIADDTLFEGPESFDIEIVSAVDSEGDTIQIGTGAQTVTIIDTDGPPVVTLDDVTVIEGETMVFTITLSHPAAQDVTGKWHVLPVTVSADDFGGSLPAGDFTIPAGQTTFTISIPTTDDMDVEDLYETFLLSLSEIENATPETVSAEGTITDNDIRVSIDGETQTVFEDSGEATVTFSINRPSDQDIIIEYQTVAGTAGVDDFTSVSSAFVTIPAGQTSVTVSIGITDDALYEDDESFDVRIIGASDEDDSPIIIGNQTQTITITSDDAMPTISMMPAGTLEGGNATFTVVSSAVSGVDITGTWRIEEGTANAVDFPGGVLPSGTFTIPAGSLTAIISIPTFDDTLIEGTESFTIVLEELSGTSTPDMSAIGTIFDNDMAVSLTTVVSSVSEADGTATVSVGIPYAIERDIIITYQTVTGTADGDDFTQVALGTVVIPAGSTSVDITVDITNDIVFEGDETFQIVLLDAEDSDGVPITLGETDTHTVTIIDDDLPPTLTIADASALEGEGFVFTVTASHPAKEDITGVWALSAGTADLDDFDGTEPFGTFTILAGETTATITFNSSDDAVIEPDETFTITLSGINNADPTEVSATGTIINNDFGVFFADTAVTVNEGPGATHSVVFSITSAYPRDIVISYGTADGTAGSGDYTGIPSGTVIIPAGQLTASVDIPIIDDAIYEGGEKTFSVTITGAEDVDGNPIGVGNATQTVTIIDDETPPTLSMQTVRATEGDDFVFTITASHASDAPITGTWNVVMDGANPVTAADISPFDGTFTIPAGQTSVTFVISSNDNDVEEGDKTFSVVLGDIEGADDSAEVRANGIMTDNEMIVEFDTLTSSVIENEGFVSVDIRITAAQTHDVVVLYSTRNGTASTGDFTGVTSGSVTIPAGQLTATIQIPITDDTVYELDEYFDIELLSASSNGDFIPVSSTDHRVTIQDDDTAPALTMSDITVSEGQTGSFVIQVSTPSTVPITGSWAILAGTADAADFPGGVLPSGTFTIPAGQTSISVSFPTASDTLIEGDESFSIQLSGISGSSTTTLTAEGTITDNVTPALTMSNVSVIEGGTGTVTFTLAFSTIHDVTGSWEILAGTANAADFPGGVLPSGTFTIPAGQTSVSVTFATYDDDLMEGNETFGIRAYDITGSSTTQTTAAGTIADNDILPVVSATPFTVAEGEDGQLVISIDMIAGHDVTGSWAVLEDSATAADFPGGVLPSGTFTIPAGQTSVTITIPTFDDTFEEGDETFDVRLFDMTGTSTDSVVTVGTITDNDTRPTLSMSNVTILEGDTGLVTITLSAPSAQDVTGSWETLAGTANAADFGGAFPGGTFTIPAGQTSVTIEIPTAIDALIEDDETFSIRIFDTDGTSTTTLTSGGTIEDNTLSVGFSTESGTVIEGTPFYAATLTLSKPHSKGIMVAYTTVNGTAGASDYVPVTHYVLFEPGQTSAEVLISILDDTAQEDNKNFFIRIDSATDEEMQSIVIRDDMQEVTIIDNDLTLEATFTTASSTVGEGIGNAQFTVSINEAHTHDVIITYTLQPGTAIGGEDYQSPSGTLTVTIPAGQTTAQISVPIIDDSLYEGADEAFQIFLSSAADSIGRPVNISGNFSHEVTIVDNDSVPAVLIESTPTHDSQPFTFTIRLSNPTVETVTGNWTFIEGTATAADFDFGGLMPSGTFTIPAGQDSITVTVDLMTDGIREGLKDFTIEVDDIKGADPTPATGNGQIIDLDAIIGFTQGGGSVMEGDSIAADVEMSFALSSDVIVHYEIIGGTATGNADFIAGTGFIVIPAGHTTGSITAQTLRDMLIEGDEDFSIRITDVQASGDFVPSIDNDTFTVTITDDVAAPSISLNAPVIMQENGGTQTISLERNPAINAASTVMISIGGAGLSVVYDGVTYQSGEAFMVSFAALAVLQTIEIIPVDDPIAMGNGTITITLSDPVNATLTQTSHTITLVDDESGGLIIDDYGAPGPVVDGAVHGVLAGDNDDNTLSIGETFDASIIHDVSVQTGAGIDRVTMLASIDDAIIRDNSIVSSAGQLLASLRTEGSGLSEITDNSISGTGTGADSVSLTAAGGVRGHISSNDINLAATSTGGGDGENTVAITVDGASAGVTGDDVHVGLIANNAVTGGNGADIVTMRAANGDAGTWDAVGFATGMAPGGSIIDGNTITLLDGRNRLTMTAEDGQGRDGTSGPNGHSSGGAASVVSNNTVTSGAGQDDIRLIANGGQGGNAGGIEGSANPVTHQWAVDLVGGENTNTKHDVSVTDLAGGGFVVTWGENQGTGIDVYAQYHDAAGNPVGAQFVVVTQAGSQQAPSVTALTDGGYVVAWHDAAASNGRIGYKVYNADHTVRQDTALLDSGPQTDNMPVVQSLEGGGFVVAWAQTNTHGTLSRIQVSRFDADGQATGAPMVLAPTLVSRSMLNPQIVSTADGGFIVAWNTNTGNGEWQRFDASGNAVTSVIALPGTASGTALEIISLPNGDVLAMPNNGNAGAPTIYRYNAAGVQTGTMTAPHGYMARSEAIALPDGGFVLASMNSQTGTLHLSRYSMTGVLIGVNALSVASDVANAGGAMDISAVGENSFVVTWHGAGQSGIQGALYTFDEDFNIGGDAAVIEGNNLDTGDGADMITLAATGGTSGAAAEDNGANHAANLVSRAGAAAVVRDNTVNSGNGDDTVTLSAHDGDAVHALVNGAASQILGNDINLGDGQDKLYLNATGGVGNALSNRIANNIFNLGSGNDLIASQSSIFADNRVLLNGGDNNASIMAAIYNSNIVTADGGNNLIQITNVQQAHGNRFTFGGGNNILAFSGADGQTSTVTGFEVDTGNGANTITLAASNVSHAGIRTGAGNDTINVHADTALHESALSLGGGTNQLNITSGAMGRNQITGGSGQDTVLIEATGTLTDNHFALQAGKNTLIIDSTAGVNGLLYDDAAGENEVIINGGASMAGHVYVLGNLGNTVSVATTGGSLLDFTVTGGSGQDSIALASQTSASDITFDMVTGGTNSASVATQTGAVSNVTYTGGSGADALAINSGGGASMITATLGSGASVVDIEAGGAVSNVEVDGGEGQHDITVHAGGALAGTNIDFGLGAHALSLRADGGTLTDTMVQTLGSFDAMEIIGNDDVDELNIQTGAGNQNITIASIIGSIRNFGLTVGAGDIDLDVSAGGDADDASIILDEGSHVISMQAGGSMNNLSLSAGNGDVTLTLAGDTAMNNASVILGDGTHTMSFGGNIDAMSLLLGVGDNTVTFTHGFIQNSAYTLTQGVAYVTIDAAVTGFSGNSITTGIEEDTILINSLIEGSTFTTGEGADILEMVRVGTNTIHLGTENDVMDTLRLTDGGAHNLSGLGGTQVTGVEVFDLANGSANTITVDLALMQQADVIQLGGITGQGILIRGDAADVVNILSAGGTVVNSGLTQEVDGITYRAFVHFAPSHEVYVLVQDGVGVQVDGGPVGFENPMDDLSTAAVDFAHLVNAQPEIAPAQPAPDSGKVITFALYGEDGRIGGPLMQAVSQAFAVYQAALQAGGVEVTFRLADGVDDTYFDSHADIAIAAGNGILGRLVAQPDDYIGLSAGSTGQATSMLINAPDAPAGFDAAALTGDIFLSDAFLKLAAMGAEDGGGLEAGTLAYYVLLQEIGHSLGLPEFSDAALLQAGYDPAQAHAHTTTDETIAGLTSLEDLKGLEFAAEPGAIAIQTLIELMQEHGDDAFALWAAQMSGDADMAALAAQAGQDQALDAFITHMENEGLAVEDTDSLSAAMLEWAQETYGAPANDDTAAPAPAADTESASQPQTAPEDYAEHVSMPVPDETEVACA